MNMLMNLVLALQLISALVMIGLVLIQHGKGADMGASFGSGASGSLSAPPAAQLPLALDRRLRCGLLRVHPGPGLHHQRPAQAGSSTSISTGGGRSVGRRDERVGGGRDSGPGQRCCGSPAAGGACGAGRGIRRRSDPAEVETLLR